MNIEVCPLLEKCPIFVKGVLYNERSSRAYKNLYCLNANKFKQCKRYMVSLVINGTVPENVLPNSVLSVDEIIEQIKIK